MGKQTRLDIIKGTPYLINDNVLLKDFKWLIGQAEENARLIEGLEDTPYIHYGGEEFVWVALYNEALLTIECLKIELNELRPERVFEKEGKRMKLEIKQVLVDSACESCSKYPYLSEEWAENHEESSICILRNKGI